ncbi:MAG: DNA gyrase inhibitor YacG [Deltaproteobacteria bacterium]
MVCPICARPVAPKRENPAFPFCSPRCKLIDLGKWLGDEYRVPERPGERESEEGPLAPAGDDEEPS